MKRFSIIILIGFLFISCNVDNESLIKPINIKDIDGNTYSCIKLNNIWMAENLNVTHYRNGDSILHIQDKKQWFETKEGAWCYNMIDTKKEILYNWYAVNDSRGLAPKGFHIPSNEEFRQLKIYLGDGHAKFMKSKLGWKENGSGNNSTGFNAEPGGIRFLDKAINYVGYSVAWWTTNENYEKWALYTYLHYNNDNMETASTLKKNGLSVRCVKDYDLIENRYLRTINTFLKRIFNS